MARRGKRRSRGLGKERTNKEDLDGVQERERKDGSANYNSIGHIFEFQKKSDANL